ncbi:hypothetical protein G9U51_11910 [Calidifontibacter sp. DB0510]|uniref:Uncharacterized protein n=1 Tax=Metallococcus carri TaxID=1656884 RepID=A0A967B1B3_9MICO|nr:hypothetical protein [Metallococcus carri]NHN56483.1 hypothetical protein [Metallococcus carri]NOP36107.1 hypothetical protein [Calidifontibacter sp. DB2511S]
METIVMTDMRGEIAAACAAAQIQLPTLCATEAPAQGSSVFAAGSLVPASRPRQGGVAVRKPYFSIFATGVVRSASGRPPI